jgi:hypothetical protein
LTRPATIRLILTAFKFDFEATILPSTLNTKKYACDKNHEQNILNN